jgi:hypothetical protein
VSGLKIMECHVGLGKSATTPVLELCISCAAEVTAAAAVCHIVATGYCWIDGSFPVAPVAKKSAVSG